MPKLSLESALQIPERLKRQASTSKDKEQAPPASEPAKAQIDSHSDDWVTLSEQLQQKNVTKIDVNDYKKILGKDNAFVNDTIRKKIAEHGLPAQTPIRIERSGIDKIEVSGPIPEPKKEAISQELSQNQPFQSAFRRLSQNQPTLNYVDTVVKLNTTYGVNNTLFDSIVSERQEHNGLNDLATRYQSIATQQFGQYETGESFRLEVVS